MSSNAINGFGPGSAFSFAAAPPPSIRRNQSSSLILPTSSSLSSPTQPSSSHSPPSVPTKTFSSILSPSQAINSSTNGDGFNGLGGGGGGAGGGGVGGGRPFVYSRDFLLSLYVEDKAARRPIELARHDVATRDLDSTGELPKPWALKEWREGEKELFSSSIHPSSSSSSGVNNLSSTSNGTLNGTSSLGTSAPPIGSVGARNPRAPTRSDSSTGPAGTLDLASLGTLPRDRDRALISPALSSTVPGAAARRTRGLSGSGPVGILGGVLGGIGGVGAGGSGSGTGRVGLTRGDSTGAGAGGGGGQQSKEVWQGGRWRRQASSTEEDLGTNGTTERRTSGFGPRRYPTTDEGGLGTISSSTGGDLSTEPESLSSPGGGRNDPVPASWDDDESDSSPPPETGNSSLIEHSPPPPSAAIISETPSTPQQQQQSLLHQFSPSSPSDTHAQSILSSLSLNSPDPLLSSLPPVQSLSPLPPPGLLNSSSSSTPQPPPTTDWEYRDPSGQIQGPFSPSTMHDWFLQRYFSGDLLVRRIGEEDWETLDELRERVGAGGSERCFLIASLKPRALGKRNLSSGGGWENAAFGSNEGHHQSQLPPPQSQQGQGGLATAFGGYEPFGQPQSPSINHLLQHQQQQQQLPQLLPQQQQSQTQYSQFSSPQITHHQQQQVSLDPWRNPLPPPPQSQSQPQHQVDNRGWNNGVGVGGWNGLVGGGVGGGAWDGGLGLPREQSSWQQSPLPQHQQQQQHSQPQDIFGGQQQQHQQQQPQNGPSSPFFDSASGLPIGMGGGGGGMVNGGVGVGGGQGDWRGAGSPYGLATSPAWSSLLSPGAQRGVGGGGGMGGFVGQGYQQSVGGQQQQQQDLSLSPLPQLPLLPPSQPQQSHQLQSQQQQNIPSPIGPPQPTPQLHQQQQQQPISAWGLPLPIATPSQTQSHPILSPPQLPVVPSEPSSPIFVAPLPPARIPSPPPREPTPPPPRVPTPPPVVVATPPAPVAAPSSVPVSKPLVPSPTPSPSPAAKQPTVAPWVDETPKPSSTPTLSLRQIQELEAKASEARKTAERQANARTQALAAVQAAQRAAAAEAEALPSSSTWASPAASVSNVSTPEKKSAPAPWLKGVKPVSGSGGKTLKEIQEEEERRKNAAKKEAKDAAERIGATAGAAGVRGGYAGVAVGGAKPAAGAPWTTIAVKPASIPVVPVARPVVPGGPLVAPPRGAAALPAKPQPATSLPRPTVGSSALGSVPSRNGASTPVKYDAEHPPPPSAEFMKWCKDALTGLTVPMDEFIQMLLSFPLEASADVLEIISDSVYANSSTLDGRRFANDFSSRRKLDVTARYPNIVVKSKGAIATAGKPTSMAEAVKVQPVAKTPEWQVRVAGSKKKKGGK